MKDGQFLYTFDIGIKNPFLVSLCYRNIEGKPGALGVMDYVRSTAKDTFNNTGFMLAYGSNEISGDWNDRFHRVSLKPNAENDLMFAHTAENVMASRDADNTGRLIRKNSGSYYLLMLLNNYKDRYKKAELEKLLHTFDKNLLRSGDAVKISDYASFSLDKSTARRAIVVRYRF